MHQSQWAQSSYIVDILLKSIHAIVYYKHLVVLQQRWSIWLLFWFGSIPGWGSQITLLHSSDSTSFELISSYMSLFSSKHKLYKVFMNSNLTSVMLQSVNVKFRNKAARVIFFKGLFGGIYIRRGLFSEWKFRFKIG